MNSQTRIIVISHKNLIYLAVAIAVIITLTVLILLSGSNNSVTADNNTEYTAGVYSSTIVLNGNPVDIQVTMDTDKIHDINIVNTSESIATMYPMFSSCFDEIRSQVISNNSTQNITYSSDNRYTSIVITNAIEDAIEKSRP